MGKKSASQIRRMQARAKARGDEYIYEQPVKGEDIERKGEKVVDKKVAAAMKLQAALKELEENSSGMNAKERRAAKRKAEAIAIEEAMEDGGDVENPITVTDLLALIPTHIDEGGKENKRKADDAEVNTISKGINVKPVPYIVFVGQLSYTTTSEGLLEYFCSGLGLVKDKDKNRLKVRLLTHKDTGKSRGMAFIEVDAPDLLYECFKLHQTYLDGRRINVERTCGGRGNKNQAEKLMKYREEHKEYISNTVDQMIQEFIKDGQMEEGELDEGAVALCKRNAMASVEQALTEYVESRTRQHENDSNFENPSAYFTKILSRIAVESIPGASDESDGRQQRGGNSKRRRKT